jgi:hypothetical protein
MMPHPAGHSRQVVAKYVLSPVWLNSGIFAYGRRVTWREAGPHPVNTAAAAVPVPAIFKKSRLEKVFVMLCFLLCAEETGIFSRVGAFAHATPEKSPQDQ